MKKKKKEMNYISNLFFNLFDRIGMNRIIAKSFCLTFSVGSDNIIVYLSFFTQINYYEIIIAISIFLLMSILYGFLAIKLSKTFEATLIEYSIYLEPIAALAIIGIGLYIISESIIFHK